MYRIAKTLNHNSFIGVEEENNREYLVMGKGIAFGKKTGQRVQPGDDTRIYSLTEMTERGNARTIVQDVSPHSLELASAVLDEAEKEFGKIDRSIVFPMADHLDFAVRRIQNGEQISNPLTDDIRVMFYKEYKVASCIGELLKERLQIEIDEHEIGYLALHVHSAIVEENVSQAMEVARAVRESISLVEHITGHTIDVMSLSYNRMMNHIRYMVARAVSGEKLKVNMNDYMSVKFPEAFRAAKRICEEMEKRLKLPMEEIEIGYLAMHIERIMDREEGELGIHARPAGMLVKEAKKFASECTITKDGKTKKLTQLMMLMSLGVKQGDTVTVAANGEDEDAAIETLKAFFEANL